jgi:hypothetical protein
MVLDAVAALQLYPATTASDAIEGGLTPTVAALVGSISDENVAMEDAKTAARAAVICALWESIVVAKKKKKCVSAESKLRQHIIMFVARHYFIYIRLSFRL